MARWGGGDEKSYIVSCNLKRRHLTTSQRTALATEFEEPYAEKARKRIESTQFKSDDDGGGKFASPGTDVGKARDQVAKDFAVSGRSVSDAKKVMTQNPELFEEYPRTPRGQSS